MMTLLVEFFNTLLSLSAGVESIFLLGIKMFFVTKRWSDVHFQVLMFFLKEINNLLFANLVACIICFEYWFCTVV